MEVVKNMHLLYKSTKCFSFADKVKDKIFIYFDRKKKNQYKIEGLQKNKTCFS